MLISTFYTKHKLSLMFVSLFMLLIIFSTFKYLQRQNLSQRFEQTSSPLANAIQLSVNADRDLYQAYIACQNYLIKMNRDDINTQIELQTFKQKSVQALQGISQARILMADQPLVEDEMREFEADYNQWITRTQAMITLADRGQLQDAIELNNTVLQQDFMRLRKHYDVMGEIARNLYNQSLVQ